jgi:hypothetical protein
VIQIEGEDYVEMSGVSTEACTDQGGGQNVAEIDGIDWMKYENITISTSGYYTFVYRVSSLNGNAQFTPRLNNEDLDVLTIGATNGWQQWVSVSQSIYLESGSQVLEVYSNSSGWNLNWIQIIPEQLITNVDDMTAERGWHVVPNPAHDELRLIQEGISETVSSVVAIDMRGMKTELTFNHSRVDISMLKKGLYTLVWQVNNQVRTQSFVKKQ